MINDEKNNDSENDLLYRVEWWQEGEREHNCLPDDPQFYITKAELPALREKLREYCIEQMTKYVCDGCNMCCYGDYNEWCKRRFSSAPEVVDAELKEWFRMVGEKAEWNYLRITLYFYEENTKKCEFGRMRRKVEAETPMKDVVVRNIINLPRKKEKE